MAKRVSPTWVPREAKENLVMVVEYYRKATGFHVSISEVLSRIIRNETERLGLTGESH